MLSTQDLAAAADLIAAHWRDGKKMHALPDHLRPTSRVEGYAIQAHLEALGAKPLFGWKIAATSLDGQRHINVDGPLAGRLLAERVLAAGEAVSLAGNHMQVAEPEFAFRMAETLRPRATAYSLEEVMAAVGALHLAIEIPDSRFIDFTKVGAPQLIADDACAHQFLLGPAADDMWRGLDLGAHELTGTVAGKLTRQGSGRAVLGDPRLALAWLANELSGLGIPLAAGQVVTTGTCTIPLPIAPGDSVVVDYGVLGQIGLHIAA